MLADRSENERVLWALPRGPWSRSDGVVFDLDAEVDDIENRRLTWDTTVASLSEWIALARPPVLMNHNSNGDNEGQSRRLVVLKKAQAEAHGIEQPTDEAAYVSAELVESRLRAYDEGKNPTMSPHVQLGYVDSTGRRWPIVLREISFAADQRLKPQHARNLTSARLSEGAATEEGQMTPEQEAQIAALAEQVAALGAKVAELETAMSTAKAEGEEEAPEGDGAQMSEAQTLETLRAENAALKSQLRKAEADAFVSATLAERELDAASGAKLHELYVESPTAAKAAAAFAPVRGKAAAPAAAAAPRFTATKTGPAATIGAKLSEGEAPTTKAAIRAAAAAAGMSTVDYLKATSQTATN